MVGPGQPDFGAEMGLNRGWGSYSIMNIFHGLYIINYTLLSRLNIFFSVTVLKINYLQYPPHLGSYRCGRTSIL